MRPLVIVSALAASLLGCASQQKPASQAAAPAEPASSPATALPGDEDQGFQASGEIIFFTAGGTGSSAAFGDRRIVGPSVNLTRGEEGTWEGDLVGQSVRLDTAPDRITGAGVNLYVERVGDAVSLRGIWFDRRISLDLTPKSVSGRAGQVCSVDVERKAPGVYRGSLGCVVQDPRRKQQASVSNATLRLAGDAALDSPPMPQFVLALVAVLPP
jgi:hypothetical protein